LTKNFIIPQKPEIGDVVINEILFNPRSGANDFVEIYNGSSKYIDLDGWQLANVMGDTISQLRDIVSEYRLLPPGGYMVFTEELNNLIWNYPSTVSENILITDLPGYPDSKGTVILLSERSELMDWLNYQEDMHLPLLDEVEGISLERIQYVLPSNDNTNWHSAASTVGYATPGYRNSQAIDGDNSGKGFYPEPNIFSPDNDGYHDIVSLNYNIGESGYVGSIFIYNSSGLLIRKLIDNELLETKGAIIWDGMKDDQSKAPMGYYILIMESFNDAGKVRMQKASVVLAHSLK
jgi:hypothetical protein